MAVLRSDDMSSEQHEEIGGGSGGASSGANVLPLPRKAPRSKKKLIMGDEPSEIADQDLMETEAALDAGDANEESAVGAAGLDESDGEELTELDDDILGELDAESLVEDDEDVVETTDVELEDDAEMDIGSDADKLERDVVVIGVDEDDEVPSVSASPPHSLGSPGLLDSVQTHSQAIMASIEAFQAAERKEREAAIQAERMESERRIAFLQDQLEDAQSQAKSATDELNVVRGDSQEIVSQLSLALDQVRKHTALVGVLRQEIDSLQVTASVSRKEAEWAKEQLQSERQRGEAMELRVQQAKRQADEAEMNAQSLQSEIDTLRRMLSNGSGRPLTSRVANDDMGRGLGAAVFPVQVTAVIDCNAGSSLPDVDDAGVGVVLDVRLVAAIPSNSERSSDGVGSAVELAHLMFPTAPLSVIVGDDCDLAAYQSRYGDVSFVAAPADDSRRKAARVLSNAAGHLRRGGPDRS